MVRLHKINVMDEEKQFPGHLVFPCRGKSDYSNVYSSWLFSRLLGDS